MVTNTSFNYLKVVLIYPTKYDVVNKQKCSLSSTIIRQKPIFPIKLAQIIHKSALL